MIRSRHFRFLWFPSVQAFSCLFFLISSFLCAASPFQLLHSSSNTLTVEFRLPKPDRQASFSQLIGIPAGSKPRVTVTSLKLVGSPDTNANSSPNSVSVAPIGIIRDQYIARIDVQPFHTNKIHEILQFQIDFDSPPIIRTTDRNSPYFEDFFRSNLLNYHQALNWRNVPQPTHTAPARALADFPQYKVFVSKTGLYKIESADLTNLGIDLKTVDLSSIRIENRGLKVGAHVIDQNHNDYFDNTDGIVFYGEKIINNKFTDENVYWVSWNSDDPSSLIDSIDVAPKDKDATVPIAFKKTEHFEKDYYHDPLVEVKSEFVDHYFWMRFTGGTDAKTREKSFRIDLPGAVPRTKISRRGELRIKFQGISTRANATHRAWIRLSGKSLSPAVEWRKQGAPLLIRQFDQNAVLHHDSPNFLNILAGDNNNTPVNRVDFYLDWAELDYWHSFRAYDGKLEFNSDTEPPTVGGTTRFQIDGFSRKEIDLYRIRKGSLVAKLHNMWIDEFEEGNYRVTFEDRVDQPTTYFAADRITYSYIDKLVPAKTSDLKNPTNQADYIVISHTNFFDSIQPLVKYRESQGMKVKIVDIDIIYDQFSHGLFNPNAIQKFLRYAYVNWRKPAPTFVLLVGDAHYDYKGSIVQVYRKDYDKKYNLYPIFVPTFHGWSPESGETAMDHRFVLLSGDDRLPDMYIGRLPSQYPHELDVVVKKIINYEKNLKRGPWQGRIVEIADNEIDNPGQDDIFEKTREDLIQNVIPVSYDTKKVYLREIVSPLRTNKIIMDSINEGVLVLEYAGHGSTQTWADEAIFRIEDARALRNKYLPFILATTCLNGQFDKPLQFGQYCLVDQFIFSEYGAVACLSATRLTYGSANAEFDKEIFRAMLSENHETLGAIIATAKTRFISKASTRWVPGAEQYTLFGDPATRLAIPELKVNVELTELVVDPNKELVVHRNSIGRSLLNKSGKLDFKIEAGFSTENMKVSANFPASAKAQLLIRERDNITVWQGEFGDVRISIPRGTSFGEGTIRAITYDENYTAIGGSRFWIHQPLIYDIRENMDHLVTNTLDLQAQIVDNEGSDGIASVKVVWSDTQNFVDNTYRMIPDPNPPGSTVKKGTWYRIEKPIPLPKGGRVVRYTIHVKDVSNYSISSKRKIVDVPEGTNLAIASSANQIAPIRYRYSTSLKKHTLIADIVNDGGRPVNSAIEVWFSEGDADKNADQQIDRDALTLGHVDILPSDWKSGARSLQETTAVLVLNTPLSTGLHKIYVFADPEDSEDDHGDFITGKIDEPRSFDNRSFTILIVNEFTLKTDEPLIARSIDHVFRASFEAGALAGVPAISISVDEVILPKSFQPDLFPAPTPRLTNLVKAVSDSNYSAYKINLLSDKAYLTRPTQVDFLLSLDQLHNKIQNRDGLYLNQADHYEKFKAALNREVESISMYRWKTDIKAWQRIDSKVKLDTDIPDEHGNFPIFQEKFVTPTRAENRNLSKLSKSQIHIDPNLTPIGQWVILFLNKHSYEVLIKLKGSSVIEKLGQNGYVNRTFKDEILGLELNLNDVGSDQEFEFGDVLIFETEVNVNGQVQVDSLRKTNAGNGIGYANVSQDYPEEFLPGAWLIFFTQHDRFEIHDGLNTPIRYLHGSPVVGRVNQPLTLKAIGIDLLINSGDRSFQFGDKMKFSTSLVGVLSTTVTELTPLTLSYNTDRAPPKIKLWVDGEEREPKSQIEPRPEISILLQDVNGIDTDSFSIQLSKDEGPFAEVNDFEIANKNNPAIISIEYEPILFIGRYLFRVRVKDLNGNKLGGDFTEFLYRVDKNPDLYPPEIDMYVNDTPLVNGTVLREQPKFDITINDDKGLDAKTIKLFFNVEGNQLEELTLKSFDIIFDPAIPTQANMYFAPDTPNANYQIRVTVQDKSGNLAESPDINFQIDEPVKVAKILNIPNPIKNQTFFTYELTQAPYSVEIKIYTVGGRLIRTISDASAKRGYNEQYWNARDEDGIRLANGTYFYKVKVQIEDQHFEKIKRLAVLR